MFSLGKLFKSDVVKMGAAAGAGYLLGKYAPQMSQKVTDVRQMIQAKRSMLFPNYGKGPDSPTVTAGGEAAPAAATVLAPQQAHLSLFQRILAFIFGERSA